MKTLQDIIDILEAWETNGEVYKAEFDRAKHSATTVLDREISKIKSDHYYGREDQSKAEQEIATALISVSLMTFPSKKLMKLLNTEEQSNFITAINDLVERWKPVADQFREVRSNLKTGRKPNPNAKPVIDDSHLRGTCSVCQRHIKIQNGKIVDHGFNIKFGFRSNKCFGTGYPPLEVSKEGSIEYNKMLEGLKSNMEKRIENLKKGNTAIPVKLRNGTTKLVEPDMENYANVQRYVIRENEGELRNIEYEIDRIQKIINQ